MTSGPSAKQITLDAPSQADAGQEIEVSWTDEVGIGDYITILPRGASRITDEDYVNMSHGSPVKIKAPTTPGEYDLLCIEGETVDAIKARYPLTVE